MFENYCFDLDGTLTDPSLGITNAVVFALKKWHIEVEDQNELKKFIGPPLYESFEKFYGFSHEESVEAVAAFREYYKDQGIFENRLFPEVPALLDYLKEHGKKLFWQHPSLKFLPKEF